MGWGTLYIHGKPGFEQEVLDRLEQSSMGFMPGSMGGEQNIALYWVDERSNVRDFKKAIGSEIVFKYRLRFFSSLESLHEYQDQRISATENFTPQEQALILEMTHWDETHPHHQHYKHSA